MLGIKPEENQGRTPFKSTFSYILFQVATRNANSQNQKVPQKRALVLFQLWKHTHTHTLNLFSFSFQFILWALWPSRNPTTPGNFSSWQWYGYSCLKGFKKTKYHGKYPSSSKKSWKIYDLIYTFYNIISAITNLKQELV